MALATSINPEDAPSPEATCADVRRWGTELGGVPIDKTPIAVYVEGQRSTAVVITTMRARILEQGDPLSAAQFIGCTGAGSRPSHGIGFDLDAPDPRARGLGENDELSLDFFFEDNYVAVADGEAIAFNVVGMTQSSYVRWVIDVVLLVEGEEETITIGDEGFETTATTDFAEKWTWGVPGGGPCCRLVLSQD